MLAFEHYMLLAHKINPAEQMGLPHEISLEQIAEALHCTPRNAKLVLRRLEDDGLIAWQAGRGRGNRSKLSFLANKESLLLVISRQLAEKEEYKQAFELLQRYGAGTQAADKFTEWLSGRFGFSKEQGDGSEVKDTLRLPLSVPILTLDPAKCMFSLDSHMIQQLFDRLVHYDAAADRVIPQIAHTWENDAGATEWTFHLRKGVYFHNGKELTAEDVVFNFTRMRKGQRNSWLLRSLHRVEAVSERTVRFLLTKPNHIFPRFLCSIALSIVPLDFAGLEEDAFWKRPIGTGPFQIAEWTNERFVMNANTRYFQGRPHLDSVIIVFMPNTVPSQALWHQLLNEPERQEEEFPREKWESAGSKHCCTSLLTWNMNKAGTHQSIYFRRAVDLLIDRSRMVRELGEFRLCPAKGYFQDDQTPFWPESYDPETAKELLLQAGYDGSPITIGTYGHHIRDAEWIRMQCAAAGIPVHIHYEKRETIQQVEVMNKMDCILHALVFPEKEVCLIENYEQESSFVKELQTAEWQALIAEKIDEALESKYRGARLDILDGIENRLKQSAHVSFLLHTTFRSFSSPSYKGIGINLLGWIDFKEVWRA